MSDTFILYEQMIKLIINSATNHNFLRLYIQKTQEVMLMEDAEIIKLYFDRNETAITETAQKYDSYCYTIAFNVLGSEEDSKETVNDTYLETWKSIPPNCPSVFSAFIGKITRRLAISKLRKRTAEKRGGNEYQISLDELSECVADRSNIEKEMEEKEVIAVINQFLRDLPEIQRNVFICRYWYMDSILSIAKEFHFSESKVKSMLMRTRQKLKQILTKEGLL